jgi:hypothetical protein
MADGGMTDSRGAADYALDALDRATAVRGAGAGGVPASDRRGAVPALGDLPGLDFSFSAPSFLSGRSRWVLFCLLAVGGFLAVFLAYRMTVDAPPGHGAEWVIPPVFSLVVGAVAFAFSYATVMGFGQVTLTTKVGAGTGAGAGPSATDPAAGRAGPAFGIASVSPADRAVGVPATTAVTAVFSAAVAAATVSATTFTLRRQGAGSSTPATVTLDADGVTARLQPGAALDPGATYEGFVSGSVQDATGRALGGATVWVFTTAAADAGS